MIRNGPKEFDFDSLTTAGLIIGVGGFEDRSITFFKRLKRTHCSIEHPLLLHYRSQATDNEENHLRLMLKIKQLTGKRPTLIPIHAEHPIQSSVKIEETIKALASQVENRTAIIDISGMTHLWALTTIHSCVSNGFYTKVVYTEARSYFPTQRMYNTLVRAWKSREYEVAAKYFQSSGLKAIHIQPDFAGNFRPGAQTCLMVFVGYEPNRIQGLVDIYAPGAMIVFYGKSPHNGLQWRTDLSRSLHEEMFSQWKVRRTELSTLNVNDILDKLEDEFKIIREHYDVAIAPQCSKMQALASYLFWRRHPEIQLLFTSPVRFNPNHYSKGSGRTFIHEVI
jgi:hypothetical protein